jgi:hypothetical protein
MNFTSPETARLFFNQSAIVRLVVTKLMMAAPPAPILPQCTRVAGVCVPGTRVGPGQMHNCSMCPSGSFTTSYASTGCNQCPIGWDTRGFVGQSMCWPVDQSDGGRGPCPRGHCSTKGICAPCGCPVHMFADTITTSISQPTSISQTTSSIHPACLNCPEEGMFTDDTADCRRCKDGSIFIFNGGCQLCPLGKFSARGNECVSDCPIDFYRNSPVSCAQCPGNSTSGKSGVCQAKCS